MKIRALAVFLLSGIWFTTQTSISQAQDWPDPLVELVSISTDTSSFYTDNRLKFNLVINRINGSTYSDITRVWVCPERSWDGFLCNSGQFLVSITPNSTDTNFTIESPSLTLADGNYLITGVSFRNGAILSGFTLMYPRTGVVTIGGIATTIPLVNLALADFTLMPPTPEEVIEPEPIVEPEPDPEGAPESTVEPEPDVIDEKQDEVTTETESKPETQLDPTTDSPDPAQSQSQSSDSEPTTETVPADSLSTTDPTVTADEIVEESTESEVEPVIDSTTSPEPTESVETNSTDSTPITQPIVESQPKAEPIVISPQLPIVVITPEAKPEINPEPEIIKPEPSTIEIVNSDTPLIPASTMKQLRLNRAVGGKVMQVTGETKLIKPIAAGASSLKLLASNNSNLTILLNQRIISQLTLTRNQTITWFSRKPGKLKLLLKGDNPELLIDSLKVNGKLFANPTFQMRN